MILLYSNIITPRLEYVCEFIFEVIGIEYKTTTDLTDFISYNGPKINYSTQIIQDSFQILPHKLLFERSIENKNIEVLKDPYPFFFKTEGDFKFDIFSSVFFLISRYEEYLPSVRDGYNRYLATNSLAYKYNFLTFPIVDLWINELKTCLINKFKSIEIKGKQFKWIPTIDVDVAYYSYIPKGLVRGVLSFLKDIFKGNIKEIKLQFQILLGKQNDPYDNYKQIFSIHQEMKLESIFFITIGKHSKYDKNISYKSQKSKQLYQQVSKNATIGIHPSYNSNKNREILNKEIQQLSRIVDYKISKSRQHFLILDLPVTYRNLINCGINEDYTMGYAEEPGFRAGTCSPFYFYDLEKEEKTALKILPFAIMDGTLNDYKKYTPEEALLIVKKLINEVKKYNGTFITIWHNSSLSELNRWKGWKNVYNNIFK